MWANLHLLFWLSLTPFATAWMGETALGAPTAVYGGVLLAAGDRLHILVRHADRRAGAATSAPSAPTPRGSLDARLRRGHPAGPRPAVVGLIPIVAVAVMWLVPDRRIERYLDEERAR